MPKWMSCGESLLLSSCQIQPIMKKATKKAQNYWLSGAKWWKNSYLNLISQRKKSKIFWIKWLQGTQNWPNMSYQTKKDPSTTNSIILMSGQISRPWSQNCHSMPSLLKWSDKHQIKSSCQKSVSGRNSHQNTTRQPTGKPFMPNWNLVQL